MAVLSHVHPRKGMQPEMNVMILAHPLHRFATRFVKVLYGIGTTIKLNIDIEDFINGGPCQSVFQLGSSADINTNTLFQIGLHSHTSVSTHFVGRARSRRQCGGQCRLFGSTSA